VRLSVLLHGYQPPTQDEDVLLRVLDEAYEPTLRVLAGAPSGRPRLTLNLSPELAERLSRARHPIIGHIADALSSGKIELTATPYCH